MIDHLKGPLVSNLIVILTSTSNDDQPIQVQTAACCHRSIQLLSRADLIDTPTEQIKTTFIRASKSYVMYREQEKQDKKQGIPNVLTLVLVRSKNIICDLQCLVGKESLGATYIKARISTVHISTFISWKGQIVMSKVLYLQLRINERPNIPYRLGE